jgi:hypothetical protein
MRMMFFGRFSGLTTVATTGAGLVGAVAGAGEVGEGSVAGRVVSAPVGAGGQAVNNRLRQQSRERIFTFMGAKIRGEVVVVG